MSNFLHCVKRARIQSYSGPHFPAFEMNTERYEILRTSHLSVINPNAGKFGPEITPYLETFHAVLSLLSISRKYGTFCNTLPFSGWKFSHLLKTFKKVSLIYKACGMLYMLHIVFSISSLNPNVILHTIPVSD